MAAIAVSAAPSQAPVQVGALRFTPPKGWKATSESGPAAAIYAAPDLPASKVCVVKAFKDEFDKDGFRTWFIRRWNTNVTGGHHVLRMSELESKKSGADIQTLFILRVVTEEIGAPLRKAIHKLQSSQLLAYLEPGVQEAEVPGWADGSFVGGITGLWDAVIELTGKGETALGKFNNWTSRANAILSIIKFILWSRDHSIYVRPGGKFKGEADFSFSVTRKVVKKQGRPL